MANNEEIIKGEFCPYCGQKTLTLMERVMDIPHFGILHVFGMNCENDDCGYKMSDLEAEEDRPAYKETITIDSEDQLKWYIVKSANATIKIPRMVEITPGADSDGFISTIEGVLEKFKNILEELKQDDDKSIAKKAKNQLKKLQKVMWGQDSIQLTLEDKSGNSAIIKERIKLEE